MFRLFSKKEKQKENQHPSAERAASVIAKTIFEVQSQWSKWLSIREQKMSVKQKKIALSIFAFVMVSLGCYFLYSGLFSYRKEASTWLQQPSITIPKDTRLPDSLNIDYLREVYKKRKVLVKADSATR